EIALLAALAEGVFDAVPPSIAAQVRAHLAAGLSGARLEEAYDDASFDVAAQARLVAAVRDIVQRLSQSSISGTTGTRSEQ
ncbi:F0F1 ATP synthase subunit alpha, partial [Paraburkholderia strydomiana]